MDICECYWDCRTCSLSGEPHQHADDPCPVHPEAPEDVSGGDALGPDLNSWLDQLHDGAVDAAFARDAARR